MKCPKCKTKTRVTDSRAGDDVVIRVRKCKCGTVFKTVEYLDNSKETKQEYSELKKRVQWEFYRRKGQQ